MEIVCKNCYHSTDYLLRKEKVMCTRFPPQTIVMPSGRIESIYPCMNLNDRCGEFEDKNATYQSTGPR
jgi:hypothetical protein